ncbi:MAG TPA: peptidoglycan-binding domain-containing protein [Kineosporiaceae bacterium]
MSRSIHRQAAHAARTWRRGALAGRRPNAGAHPRLSAVTLGVGAGLATVVGVVATVSGPAAASAGVRGGTATVAGRVAAAARTARPAARRAVRSIPVPPVPADLPTGIEDLAAYVRQVSCDPTPKPAVLALGRLLSSTYPGTGYVVQHDCGSDPIASEHMDGRALDWLVSARSATQRAQAGAFLDWLFGVDSAGRAFAFARRLGVMYIIWNGRIWGSWDALDGWKPYSTCAAHPEPAADAVCHRNRMHLSLSWDGALGRDSFWSRTVAAPDYGPCRPRDLNWAPPYSAPNRAPCPDYPPVNAPSGSGDVLTALVRYSGATVGPGDSGAVVSTVQRGLGIAADGEYGPFTADAVTAFQSLHGLSASGAMDAATWRYLLAVHTLSGPVARTPAPGTSSALHKYVTTVLHYNDRGPAVTALQKALKVTPTGWFGPRTRTAVIALQLRAGLAPNGVVDVATWRALGA